MAKLTKDGSLVDGLKGIEFEKIGGKYTLVYEEGNIVVFPGDWDEHIQNLRDLVAEIDSRLEEMQKNAANI